MGYGRLVWVVAAVAMIAPLGGEASHDRWRSHTFTAPQPCLNVCPEDLAWARADLDGNGSDDVLFDPCASPDGTQDALDSVGVPNQDSYADVTVGPAPPDAVALEAELYAQVDFDGYFCSEDMRWLGTMPEELVIDVAGVCWTVHPVAPWCWLDRGVIEVEEGRRYVIRVYNRSDFASVSGRWRFTTHPR